MTDLNKRSLIKLAALTAVASAALIGCGKKEEAAAPAAAPAPAPAAAEAPKAEPLKVLLHGDRQVSTKNLAREIGVKSVEPCRPEVAQRHSGYLVGGTSPFGTRKTMRVFVESSVLELPRIYINGGRRGFLVAMAPSDLVRVLEPSPVDAAVAAKP